MTEFLGACLDECCVKTGVGIQNKTMHFSGFRNT